MIEWINMRERKPPKVGYYLIYISPVDVRALEINPDDISMGDWFGTIFWAFINDPILRI